jgi:hypothetical protein
VLDNSTRLGSIAIIVPIASKSHQHSLWQHRLIRGASKIKLKKVNKKRMVSLRRVIIFLNISRHPLLIGLHCCLYQYKTLKATAAMVVLTPAKN